ncbi:trans-sulfuration enzyme family protein [Neotabrizicola sp. VNH66]|uniref:trans-sulfuration enzyme family protein n=1 Tax=Neotabrizicola sp. VNH66 TaxID=3400918 RepID=UPI003C021C58
MREETRSLRQVPVSIEGYDSLTVPVHRASTILYADADSFARRSDRGADGYVYGLYGTPTHRHLEGRITDMQRGVRTVLLPSGQAANAFAMLAVLKTGDRVLLPDTCYGPTRDFSQTDLPALGITAEFYDPTDLAALERRAAGARLIWAESPGSLTLEMQDIPAIVAIARRHGAMTGCDNTWASPLNFRPLDHGVDLVAEALSKHFGGHSDLLMGSVTVAEPDLGLRIKAQMGRYGIGVSPDDVALVMRGIETMAVRMARASASALRLAGWLQEQPHVTRVLYPPLPGAEGHAIWARDFQGAAGLFSVVFDEAAAPHVMAALDALRVISIGASFGGTRSLAAPSAVGPLRSATRWSGPEFVLRLSVGLEAPEDLEDDLTRFLAAIETCIAAGKIKKS